MGFLGFGNYAKPGRGVKKNDEQEKKRIFQFFELFSRKFTKVMLLSLLFTLFCLPAVLFFLVVTWGCTQFLNSDMAFNIILVVTMIISGALAGPAISATLKIARCYVLEKPVFLFSDFWDCYKNDFKQSFIMGLLNSIMIYAIIQAFVFYYPMTIASSAWYWVPLILVLIVTLLFIFSNFYTFLTIVSVNLPLFSIMKNSLMFAFLGMKSNFLSLIFAGGIVALALWWFPISLLVMMPLGFGFVSLIVAFNSFQHVYRFSIRPYYVQNNLPDPFEETEDEEEAVFADAT